MTITVATICLETKSGAGLMLETFAQLEAQGVRAAVGDGGSSSGFVDAIRRHGHDVLQPDRSLRGQIEAALEGAAAAGDLVFYFESDKVEFATTRLRETIDAYNELGLEYAVVGRTPEVFNTFPFAQRTVETAENTLMGDALGVEGDWVGGPAIMPSSHVAALKDSKFYGSALNGWGVPWYLLGRAHRAGMRIGVVPTGCGVHPTAADEFVPGYRLFQANQIVGCFYEGLGIAYDWPT